MKAEEELKKGAAPGNQLARTENGWQIWVKPVKLFKHFISHIKPPQILLLVLDKHVTHTQTHTYTHTHTHTLIYPRNLDAINTARHNEVQIFSLTAHTTHRKQALGVSFLKLLYPRELELGSC